MSTFVCVLRHGGGGAAARMLPPARPRRIVLGLFERARHAAGSPAAAPPPTRSPQSNCVRRGPRQAGCGRGRGGGDARRATCADYGAGKSGRLSAAASTGRMYCGPGRPRGAATCAPRGAATPRGGPRGAATVNKKEPRLALRARGAGMSRARTRAGDGPRASTTRSARCSRGNRPFRRRAPPARRHLPPRSSSAQRAGARP